MKRRKRLTVTFEAIEDLPTRKRGSVRTNWALPYKPKDYTADLFLQLITFKYSRRLRWLFKRLRHKEFRPMPKLRYLPLPLFAGAIGL